MKPKPYLNQDFALIKSECLSGGYLFEDEFFNRADSAIIAKYNLPDKTIIWRRPSEIATNPQLFVNDANPNDLDQGEIGDCWFIASAIAVAHYKDYMNYVLPTDQSFNEGEYCGAFHFRFWRFGEWVDVVVDDYLPVFLNGQLAFCSNKNVENEFWCSLLEKAYAKLNSCYEFLDGGLTQDGIIDLTGGVDESFNLAQISAREKELLWSYIKKAFKFKSVIGASVIEIIRNPGVKRELVKSNGLVANHAYAITKAIEIDSRHVHYQAVVQSSPDSTGEEFSEPVSPVFKLLRIRNPWGTIFEWKDKFSDISDEWNYIDESVKQEIGLVKEQDGEFWILYEDFLKNFHSITFVHLDLNSFDDALVQNENEKLFKWSCRTMNGKIDLREDNSLNNFPQFYVRLNDVDSEDDENKATMIISYLQKDSVAKREIKRGKYAEEFIRFLVFRILDNSLVWDNFETKEKIDLNNSEKVRVVANSGPFYNRRSVTSRFRLDQGDYLIVPMVNRNVEVNFLIRLFTEIQVGPDDLSYLNKDNDILNNRDRESVPSITDDAFDWQSYFDSLKIETGSVEETGTDTEPKRRRSSFDEQTYLDSLTLNNNVDFDAYDYLDKIYDDEFVQAIPVLGAQKAVEIDTEEEPKLHPSVFTQVNFDCKENSTANQCSIM